MGIFNRIFGGGDQGRDGASAEKAIPVKSIAEEYAWVGQHLPGTQFESQALVNLDGRSFDLLTLRGQNGEVRQVYFDISSFFGQ